MLKLGEDSAARSRDPAACRRHAAARRLAALGRPLRLLLAEDNPTNRFVALRMLKDFAIAVDVANDGRRRCRRRCALAYDVICMDMRMPEMDGLEATRIIRRRTGRPRCADRCDDRERLPRGHAGVPYRRNDGFRRQAGEQGPAGGGDPACDGGACRGGSKRGCHGGATRLNKKQGLLLPVRAWAAKRTGAGGEGASALSAGVSSIAGRPPRLVANTQ